MFIKPAKENLIIRDPVTFEILPKKGKEITPKDANFFYWKRRIIEGDVIEVIIEKTTSTSTKNTKNIKAGGKL